MTTTQLAVRLDAVTAWLRTFPTTTDALRMLQGLSNVIDAAMIGPVAQMIGHLDTKTSGQLVRDARTVTDVPGLSDLTSAG